MRRITRSIAPPFAALLAALFLFAPAVLAQGADDGRLRVLLLDYNAPIEHDVLLSHLCVQPCRSSTGCPDALVKDGVDYFSDDFAVYRPRYLGSSARFVVRAYKDKGIDLLSISGHHASGFSGDFGKGAFYVQQLADDLRGLPGRDGFFTSPSFVFLQGCWTDVESGFEGDPIEYVRHIIEDTTVRAGESERLLAAIQQMAGEDDAYRELFPNACILGYEGTQVPGGLLEIYGQVNNFLRGLRGYLDDGPEPAALFPMADARRSMERMEEVNREIDRQCRPTGWPCNLCSADAGYYRPLAAALADALRHERRRLHQQGVARSKQQADQIESVFERASLYRNTSWSCSEVDPSTRPIYPEPIDRAPFLATFLELLMVDLGQIRGDSRRRIEAELVHLLGSTTLDTESRLRLRARLEQDPGATWRRTFVAHELPALSTFRQRDFFDFLAEIGCRDCFVQVWLQDAAGPAFARVVRENAASQLRPDLGRDLYEAALRDPSARVRWLAATRMHRSLGPELLDLAAADDDPRVREAVAEVLAGQGHFDDTSQAGPPQSDPSADAASGETASRAMP